MSVLKTLRDMVAPELNHLYTIPPTETPEGIDCGDDCEALCLDTGTCEVTLFTDSQYVRQGILQWMPNWVRRGWKTSSGNPVKNRDLWERLHAAIQRHRIDWRWVKGHSGDPDNERVDMLARSEATRFKLAGIAG